MKTIKNKAVSAVIWSGAERLSGQVIRFGTTLVLARLLLPAEYGLTQMLAIFMGLAQLFINCGLAEGLIQKQNPSHRDICSVFYANLAFGAVSFAALWLGAPLIARFYSQPALVSLTRWMALDVVVNSLGIVQTTLLTKQIDFKTQVKISILSAIISGLVAVGMALKGCGVYSLVAQILVADSVRVILLWAFHRWRPSAEFSLASLKELMPFGSRVFASAVLYTAFTEIYSLVIGRIYSPAALGLYARAKQNQSMPVENLCAIVSRVALPLFASVQNDPVQLKRGVRKAVRGLVMVNFPMMVGLALVARPLVLTLLTEEWAGCIPFMQLMCISGALFPIPLVHLNALCAVGRSDLFLRLEVVKKVLIFVSVALLFRHGVKGLLIGDIVVSIVACPISSYFSKTLLNYGWREQLEDLLPFLGVSFLMGLCVWPAGMLAAPAGAPAQLAVQIISGLLAYPLVCRVFRLATFTEACEVVGSRLPRWKTT